MGLNIQHLWVVNGADTAADLAGNNAPLVPDLGSGTLTATTTQYGAAVTLGGNDVRIRTDKVSVPAAAVGAVTMALVFRFNGVLSNVAYPCWIGPGDNNGFGFKLNAATLRLFPNGIVGFVNGSALVTDADYVLVGVFRTSGGCTAWLNGVQDIYTTTNRNTDTTKLGVAIGNYLASAALMTASMFAIWHRELTTQEIRRFSADPFAIVRPRRPLWMMPATSDTSALPAIMANYRRRRAS